MKTKSFIISVVALCCSMAAQAQYATLQKSNGDVTVYYGNAALVDALNDAEQTGSVITLSGGTFGNPGTITKSVKIYGAGYETDASKGITATTIDRYYPYPLTDPQPPICFQSADEGDMLDGVTIEGVRLFSYVWPFCVQRVKNLVISKCYFGYLKIIGEHVQNVTVRQCSIVSGVISGDYKVDGVLFQNCHFANSGCTYDVPESRLQIDHCIITYGDNYGVNAIYSNNIVNVKSLPAGSTARNNIFTNSNLTSLDVSIDASGNWFKVGMGSLFTDGTNLNLDSPSTRTFTLKDNLLSTYVGTDGTPVGINGGGYTWNIIPTTPKVNGLTLTPSGTTLNVTYDAQTREDPNTLNTGE